MAHQTATPERRAVLIPASDGVQLAGDLTVPPDARGRVVFAHGSGSGRSARGLEIVPGATHLFEEPGALERVTVQARDWFLEHLSHHGRRDDNGKR